MVRGGLTTSFITKLPHPLLPLLPPPKLKPPKPQCLSNQVKNVHTFIVSPNTSHVLSCSVSTVSQHQHTTVNMESYKDAFFRRMAMAGLKPHHLIALGVSGGPDSMALCSLTSAWKTEHVDAVCRSGDFIDGLLAIIVDHGLRDESMEEARVVSARVSEMGIRCEVGCCSWPNGRPKKGHLQEAAREMRYQIFQSVCIQHNISVLLIAHHADDQAELFILRLSRNSGVLGLACMAFTSQIFPSSKHFSCQGFTNEGILLVRPLLDFNKEDMYKICQGNYLDYVEDPTNRSQLYARNRIRMSLGFSSDGFKTDLQAVISACRKTRAFVDQVCRDLLNQTVTIMEEGYAIIDLKILNLLQVTEICLSRFVALILQFISQRHRPVRGSTSKHLLHYIHTFPCKTSFTAAGCYICPAPGSKGTKVLVCCSVDCPVPLQLETVIVPSDIPDHHRVTMELNKIIVDACSYSDRFAPNSSEVHFLNVTSELILTEARRLDIIKESTYDKILSLQREETNRFIENKDSSELDSTNAIGPISVMQSRAFKPGQSCYFMNRFFLTWKWSEIEDIISEVRPMNESDWLVLTKLSKCTSWDDLHKQKVYIVCEANSVREKRNQYVRYMRASADRALMLLRRIPLAARRSLPVLVSEQGMLMAIPNIGFKCCSSLMVSSVFKPSIPLGGGYSSFL